MKTCAISIKLQVTCENYIVADLAIELINEGKSKVKWRVCIHTFLNWLDESVSDEYAHDLKGNGIGRGFLVINLESPDLIKASLF